MAERRFPPSDAIEASEIIVRLIASDVGDTFTKIVRIPTGSSYLPFRLMYGLPWQGYLVVSRNIYYSTTLVYKGILSDLVK